MRISDWSSDVCSSDLRNPHTGGTNFEPGVKPIPAGAISNPDADQLVRQWKRVTAGTASGPLRMKLLLTPRNLGPKKSGNVIAEVPGRDHAARPVIVARSEERRVGNEGVRTGRSRGSP